MSGITLDKDDDLSPTHEHIIAGIVILLFGLLFWFFNSDWNNNSEYNPANIPLVQATANPIDKKGLPVTDFASTTGVVAASTAVTASTLSTSTVETPTVDNTTSKLAVVAPEIDETAVVEESTDSTLPVEAKVETEEVEVIPAPVVDEKAEVAPVVVATETPKKDEAPAEASPQTKIPSSYTLPDGTPITLASSGFEADLQQIFAKNELNKALIFDQIYFDTGSEKINAKSDHQIRATAALMNTYPETRVLLRGHTDSKGATKKNIELSLMRANSMGLALGNLGIDTERVRILGMGDAFPINNNDTEKGRKNNRRIEILLQ